MTDEQWRILLDVTDGKTVEPLPVGLIVDCPWVPGFSDVSILDYLADDGRWLRANLAAVDRFPDVLLLPGFWAEYGMCTEPSAFGGRCVWPDDDFPFAKKFIHDCAEIDRLDKPNCRTDGMCPFVIKRLHHCREEIERSGHRIRFATSRGPMNIASYLLGHTEMLLGVKTDPDQIHKLFTVVTDFICDWLQHQAAQFPSIEGMLVLDDLIGFVGGADFQEFVVPYFKQIAESIDVPVKALHNDCHGIPTAQNMTAMGFNMFNFGFQHSLTEIREACGEEVVLLGNIPPRDVLALGTAEDVRQSVTEALAGFSDTRRLILSVGGGTPPGVSAENIEALVAAARG